jgi:hypothetical protein
MEIEVVNNPKILTQRIETIPNESIINIKDIKSILYLGIKGEILIPIEEKHTVDTYA